jgi:hypothetical protein
VRKLTSFLALLLGVSMLLVSAPAQAWAPSGGFTFNTPRPWGGYDARYKIVRKVEAAIAHTRKGETILITSYLMDRSVTVDRLVDACRRGVSVRVILDRGIEGRHARRLVRVLNSDNVDGNGPDSGPCNTALRNGSGKTATRNQMSGPQARLSVTGDLSTKTSWGKDQSYVKVCRDACRSDHSAMHTKFYAFSRTGTVNNVVMVSSANLNKGGAAKGWNDMWTMKSRPRSYAKYEQQHLLMTREKRAGTTRNQLVDGAFTTRFFPIIRAGKAKDPTLADMNRIGCFTPGGRTAVHVSMFWWSGTRGEYLAQKLINLGRNGCNVNVIVGAPSKNVMAMLRSAARNNSRIRLWDSRIDRTGDGIFDTRTHSKQLLVNGRFGGDASTTFVTTGSQNWTNGALKFADENTLNIRLGRAWRQAKGNWVRIRKHSRRVA